jgi:GntR family carbon starvation induced transcriptional regulator
MVTTIAKTGSAPEPKLQVNESVYLALKSDIVACRLMPNERLRFEGLKERYGAAFTSLREAMSRLISEGLVVLEPHRGARVADMKDEDFLDLLHVRRLIEVETIRSSISDGDEKWEAQLVAAFHVYERALSAPRKRGVPSTDRVERHNLFHDALMAGCRSQRLLLLRKMLYAQAERYLTLSFQAPSPPPDTVLTEHERIMRAALDRKPDLAAALIHEHLEGAARRVLPIADTLKRLSRNARSSRTRDGHAAK